MEARRTAAEMSGPTGVAVDPYDDVLIADYGNTVIRGVSAFTGDMFTYANALSSRPWGIAWTPRATCSLQSRAGVVQEVRVSDEKLITVAGTYAEYGYSGEAGGPRPPCSLNPKESPWTPRGTCTSPIRETT